MTTSDNWRKSSYSGSGDGNNCVEIANLHTQVAIRDSKAPAEGTLSFPTGPFTAFISNLKADTGRYVEGP
ncbi:MULTISPECIES: DUF397 domain-containing protein [unclassified Streptomyces]|uniref:DUF397 domain-containing protein n=1 Tax=unclassified Streptomyces TaxID=2593676 RepID=UPI0023669F90|nr:MULTISPECIES: DUF397 domain-containing protein [unclassified Streptomyces]MDF3140192.1 DUF397 domain-containing protein [Streptomyces sp. T21Q-yed]WDF41699.1 DUF397 domain-containing protein [Streptomyces sp. T12]